MSEDTLNELIERLERASEDLRAGELDADAAAALVDDCARIATEAAAELDRRARAVESAEPLPELARQLSLEA